MIAIIGILSSVVLASLTTARSKGQDAAVQQQMSAMRSQAELYFSSNGNKYSTTAGATCAAANTLFAAGATNGLETLLKGVQKTSSAAFNNASLASATNCGVTSAGDAWAVWATLPSGAGTFCVDSTGSAKVTASPMTVSATVCGA